MKFSIRSILIFTLLIATYMGFYRLFPGVATFFIAPYGLLVVSLLINKRTQLLAWMPAVMAGNLYLGMAFLTLPVIELVALVLLGLVAITDIAMFSVNKTRKRYGKFDADESSVILDGAVYCVAGGFVAGLKIALVVFLFSWFTIPWSLQYFLNACFFVFLLTVCRGIRWSDFQHSICVHVRCFRCLRPWPALQTASRQKNRQASRSIVELGFGILHFQ